MYEILAYLFANCERSDLSHDRGGIARRLSAAGFDDGDISEALTWLAGVVRGPQRTGTPLPDARRALRAYAPREIAKLDAGCRGFLIYLEQERILAPEMREHVIERALAASGDALTLEQLKLIVLMVLWNERTPASRLIAEELSAAGRTRQPS